MTHGPEEPHTEEAYVLGDAEHFLQPARVPAEVHKPPFDIDERDVLEGVVVDAAEVVEKERIITARELGPEPLTGVDYARIMATSSERAMQRIALDHRETARLTEAIFAVAEQGAGELLATTPASPPVFTSVRDQLNVHTPRSHLAAGVEAGPPADSALRGRTQELPVVTQTEDTPEPPAEAADVAASLATLLRLRQGLPPQTPATGNPNNFRWLEDPQTSAHAGPATRAATGAENSHYAANGSQNQLPVPTTPDAVRGVVEETLAAINGAAPRLQRRKPRAEAIPVPAPANGRGIVSQALTLIGEGEVVGDDAAELLELGSHADQAATSMADTIIFRAHDPEDDEERDYQLAVMGRILEGLQAL